MRISDWSSDVCSSDLQRDFTRMMYGPTTLYQGADLRGGLFSIHQSVGDFIELHLDALRTERDMQTEYGYSTTYYQYPTETMTSLVSPSVTFLLPHDWTINVSAAVGKDKTEFHAVGVMRATDAIYLNSSYSYGTKSRTYEIDEE